MIITKEVNVILAKLNAYNPKSIFLFQDSSFSRLSLYRSYIGAIPLYTGELKEMKGKVLAYLDQLPLEFRGQDFTYYYSNPIFITGLGLYGEEFIDDIRNFETDQNSNHSPVIIYGSPKNEKLDRISEKIDLNIDIRKPSSAQQLLYILNNLGK